MVSLMLRASSLTLGVKRNNNFLSLVCMGWLWAMVVYIKARYKISLNSIKMMDDAYDCRFIR